MNNPVIFALKVWNLTKKIDGSVFSCTVDLPLITLFANKSSSYTWQKGTAKEQGHGRKTYKVFGLNPFYWFGEDNWNMMFKQNLRNEQPCNLLPKSPEPYQERRWQSRILHSGLTLNHAFSLGHGSIKVLPTPDNTAQQRNKGMARNHTKSFEPCEAFDDYLAREGCLEDPFSKQIRRNYQPLCVHPKTPEQHKGCVNQQNTVKHNSCPILLSCNFGGTSH